MSQLREKNIFNSYRKNKLLKCYYIDMGSVNGWQLAKMKKSIPDMPLP